MVERAASSSGCVVIPMTEVVRTVFVAADRSNSIRRWT